ncbi:hypothetical protein PL501_000527 [Escherichia coli]|nr:hypothetical protein [Escherichia coli]EJN7557652.1 hypothetical protein [Escherichia coli]EKD2535909.1 hypothetical protein [Escherichia coli]EKD2538254.1 hypothetical protein [Escherichia coli]EKK1341699.1 hypothetical protein [Escherichia coli]
MSTITREWLQQAINDYESVRDELPFGLDDYQGNILAALRIALASLEAEPIGFRCRRNDNLGDWSYVYHREPDDFERKHLVIEGIYAVPPAPVSVPAAMEIDDDFDSAFEHGKAVGWNAYRAAMLQGAKPVTTAYKLRDAVETIRNSGIEIDAEKIFAERDALNAPDCWCRTCRPVTISDMRFVVCPECGNKRCPHANDHRNACTGSNEPGQEGSAYPAAPQQEVNRG